MYLSHNPYFQIGFIEIVMNEKVEERSDGSKKPTLHIINH